VHLEEAFHGKDRIFIYLYCRARLEGLRDVQLNVVRAALTPNVTAGSDFWLWGFQVHRFDTNISDVVAVFRF
jgi:hypothetical protein